MTKHAELAVELIHLAKNGVLGQVACNEAIAELSILMPALFEKMKEPGLAKLALSRGICTLLAWFRECKRKPKVKKQLLKGAQLSDEMAIDWMLSGSQLRNADLQVGRKKGRECI